jgi:hypothetical protein
MPNYLMFHHTISLPFECVFAQESSFPVELTVSVSFKEPKPCDYGVVHHSSIAQLSFPDVGVFTFNFETNTCHIEAYTFDTHLISLVFATSGMTCWMQERYLILHGALIEYKDRAIIVTGPSGSGKSTFIQQCQQALNMNVLSDDIIKIGVANQQMIGYSSYPLIKSWDNVTDNMIDISELFQNDLLKGKKIYRLSDFDSLRKVKITDLVLLNQGNNLSFDTHQFNLYNWINLLKLSTYRYDFLSDTLIKSHFNWSSSIYGQCRTHILTKNHKDHSAKEVFDCFISKFER